MARQLYDYWFVQFDFPNEEGRPYKTSGGRMIWNEKLKREIPEGWEVKSLDELCNFRNGINYSLDEKGRSYEIINVRNISASRLLLDGEFFDIVTIPEDKAQNYIVEKGDIIIARSGCPGATRLLLSKDNTLFCGFIICCTPKSYSNQYLLTYYLKSLEGTTATKSGGSILQNVSQDTLKRIYIAVPYPQLINDFNQRIDCILNEELISLKQIQSLTKQRDELLPLLMNGQVTIAD